MNNLIFGKNLAVLNRAANSYLDEKLCEYNLNRLQAEVLIFINHYPYTNQLEISNVFFLNKATVTKIMKKLELNDLIRRVKDSTDSRKKVIMLTEKAHIIFPKLKPILDGFDNRVLSLLSKEEAKQLNEYLLKATKHLLQNEKY